MTMETILPAFNPKSAIRNPQFPPAGFTLIEATFSVAIVAVVLSVAMQSLAVATRAGLGQTEQSRAAELARQLIGEIAQARYAEPNDAPRFGYEPGEGSRALFDDVDDYEDLNEQPPRSRDGVGVN